MTSLLETISSKAEASFDQPVTKINFNQWCEHWINTGIAWRNELASERLTETVNKLNCLIQQENEILNRRRDSRFQYYEQFPLFAHTSFVFYDVSFDTICHWAVPGTWREE